MEMNGPAPGDGAQGLPQTAFRAAWLDVTGFRDA